LGTALDNLALAAANDTTVLQQLTAANLALTTSNASLTAANKKLSEALAKVPATTPRPPGTPGTPRGPNKPFPGNYCWTHGHRISQHHTSATCGNKAECTWMRLRPPTRWEVAKPTRDGTHVAPDGVGGQI
jgi:hypothetical protein